MSAALNILNGPAAVVLHSVNDEEMTLQPMNVTVSGYAQSNKNDPESEGKGVKKFHFVDGPISHVVHISRSLLTNVTINDVRSIQQAGAAKRYRVLRPVDDPTESDVAFYCTMS